MSARKSGFLALLFLIAGQAFLAWKALPLDGPRGLGGDELDYAARARSLQAERQLPKLPDAERGRPLPASYRGNSNWRPVGYPVLAALVTFPSIDGEGARLHLALLQFLLAAAASGLSYVLVAGKPIERPGALGAALVLGASPWAFSYVLLVGPESLTGSLTCVGAVLLARGTQWDPTTGRPGAIALASGVALLSATALLRPENIVLVPLLLCFALFVARRIEMGGMRVAAVAAVSFVLVLGFQVGYRRHLSGRWELFGPARFFNEGALHWVDTWLATEKEAYDGFVYKLGDGSASIDALPDRAFANAAERGEVERALDLLRRNQRYTPEVDDMFRALAEKRRKDEPFKNVILTRTWRAAHLWVNTETNSQFLSALSRLPRWLSRASVGAALLAKASVLLLATLGASIALRSWREGKDVLVERLVLIFFLYAVARTLLLGLMFPWSVPRYAQAAWPGVLLCAAFALRQIDLSRTERGRSRAPQLVRIRNSGGECRHGA